MAGTHGEIDDRRLSAGIVAGTTSAMYSLSGTIHLLVRDDPAMGSRTPGDAGGGLISPCPASGGPPRQSWPTGGKGTPLLDTFSEAMKMEHHHGPATGSVVTFHFPGTLVKEEARCSIFDWP